MRRRAFASVAAVIALTLSIAGCAGNAPSEDGSSGEGKGTITISPVLTSAGVLATNAETVRQTWEYAVDEINAAGGAGGYDFKVAPVDTDATPATSVRAATQAVTQENAKILAFQTSPENAAISAQLAGLNAINMNTMAQDDGLRGASCSPNAFMIAQSNSMLFNALGAQLGELDGDKWAIMAVDYSTGHGAADAFQASAAENGKEVVSTQFAPLNTSDYGSYITEIQRSGADSLLVVMYGADAEAFVTQAAQYDLKSQIETTLTMNVITEQSFDSLGDKILDDYLVKQYDPTATAGSNAEFVKGYTEKFGSAPNDYAGNTYLGAQALFAAVEEAKSDDVEAIREALSGLTFEGIAGEVTIREEDHQALSPIYLAKVVKDGSDLAFQIDSSVAGEDSAPEPSAECKM